MQMENNGWDDSAEAWIADMGDKGDFSRRHVLDAPMLALARGRGFRTALDIGCGEGRFCRMLAAEGIATTGIDPTLRLLDAARTRDPQGNYLQARAEALPFADASFDLAVSYLTLIDIDDYAAAIAEMARVLRPGGSLLIANLNSFSTAGDWTAEGKAAASQVPGVLCTVLNRHLAGFSEAEWLTLRGLLERMVANGESTPFVPACASGSSSNAGEDA